MAALHTVVTFSTAGKTLPVVTFSTLTLSKPAHTKWVNFCRFFQECAEKEALYEGKQAHARMIISGFSPTVFVSNCLVHMYAKCCDTVYANKVFDRMPQRNTISWNSVISGYAGEGNMGAARFLFEEMPERDLVSWNSLMSGYSRNGEYWESLDIFLQMGRNGLVIDSLPFAIALKVCSSLEEYSCGVQLHSRAERMGFVNGVVIGSALVDMYAKCKHLNESLRLFYELPERNWVSWSAIIAGCVQNYKLISGLELFKEMQRTGVGLSQSVYASVFRSCASLSALRLGSQVHGHALKTDLGTDTIVQTAALDMYAKCNSLSNAKKLFDTMPYRNLQTHNAIIIGYSRSDRGIEALQVFKILRKSSRAFDEITLSGALRACAAIKEKRVGFQLHGVAIKSNFKSNICVASAMVDMYGKCGSLDEACYLFDEMKTRDSVTWNAIIAAHEQNGIEEATLLLFVSMLRSRMEPDEFTYGSVVKACAGRKSLYRGREIHSRIIKSGMGVHDFVGSALVDMYCKCGMMEDAEILHDRIGEQTPVSWNSIISGFSLQRQSEEAQKFFAWMLEVGENPDNFTYATVLDTCANLGTIGLGKQVHAQIIKQELQGDVYISSTLVDMYSKCGNMQDSRLMFDKALESDFVTWNAMICGYSHHGLGEEALELFTRMKLANIKPNHATFISVLRACGHMGLVEEGRHYFNIMQTEYGLDPQLEHYSCMVDIMGRSGQVGEAFKLINTMPFEADSSIWRTLLSICKICGNVEMAEKAATRLLELEPEDSSAYILLSNVYAGAEMWGEVSKLRRMMRYNGLKKEPGCSWIEVKDEVNTFLLGDKAHPRCEEIYELLDALSEEMKWVGYVHDTDFIIDEEGEYDPQEELLSSMASSVG